MASAFFPNFPLVAYNSQAIRNIVLKSQFFRDVLDTHTAFYPYIVKDGERADLVAFHYYGDWQYDWLVYFANDIVDPYYDWPLNQSEFDQFILKKYGNVESALTTIHHYVYDNTVDPTDHDIDYKMTYTLTKDTYSFLDVQQKSYWKPVHQYDYEFQKNEEKRSIQPLDLRLIRQVDKEISEIFRKNV